MAKPSDMLVRTLLGASTTPPPPSGGVCFQDGPRLSHECLHSTSTRNFFLLLSPSYFSFHSQTWRSYLGCHQRAKLTLGGGTEPLAMTPAPESDKQPLGSATTGDIAGEVMLRTVRAGTAWQLPGCVWGSLGSVQPTSPGYSQRNPAAAGLLCASRDGAAPLRAGTWGTEE